jgi:hypothetical protein
VPDHRHERHDPRAAAEEEDGPALARVPDEIAADRPAQLELVADDEHVSKVGGDLAVRQPLDGEGETALLRC